MDNLIKQVRSISDETNNIIDKRLEEFSSFKNKDNRDWFSELCFCILTANSKAKTALSIQNELGFNGFSTLNQNELSKIIRKNKHRFHNNKAKYLVEARTHLDIKDKVIKMLNEKGIVETRNWIAENIKGIGYKEASHFLRNVGFDNLAILDRHILNLMHENGLIQEPKLKKKSDYLDIENKFITLAKRSNLSPAKLDLIMWYLKAGEVLK